MEVFMRNLPPDLSQTSLKSQLKPHMDKLRITHYGCEKRPRQKTGKVMFITEKEAKAFLQSHGEVPLPNQRGTRRYHPTQSRLCITNHQVYCKRSDPQPRDIPLRVKNILHEAEEEERIAKAIQSSVEHHPRIKHTPSTLIVGALDCGYWSYVNGQLTFVNEWSSSQRQNLVKFSKKDLIITFLASGDWSDLGQVRVPYRSIYELVWSDDGHVALTLKFAPTFLSSPLPSDRPGPPPRMRLKACDGSHAIVSNFCLVYHFKADPQHILHQILIQQPTDFRTAMNSLTHQELFYVSNYAFAVVEAPIQDRFPDGIDKLKADLVMYEGQRALPQTLLFSLQALVHESYLHPTTVSKLAAQLVVLFETARRSGSKEHPISADAFAKLFNWIQYPSPYHEDFSQFEVEGIIEYLKETEKQLRESYTLRMNSDIPSHLTKIFRAVVTPARITFHGPELEAKNRILRKFPDAQDYFLRVQFSDEDGQDLFFNSKVVMEGIYERFKDVLTKGITVGGRVYRFLGFSHSSLRAHTVWLSAPFFDNNEDEFMIPERIISKLGDFRGIRSPARRAARIGQAFSETPYSVSLVDHKIDMMKQPDVERNGRVFSDGVGTISQGALDVIYGEIPWTKGRPTCFQVRWGGAKGMLALDARLPGRQFTIRGSMEKFPSSDTIYLEICDMASKPIPMVLNRQLIKILEDMGAPEHWFMRLQEKQLASLRRITDNIYNVSTFLKLQSIGDSIHLDQFLRDAHKMHVDYRKDPFLRGIVEAAVLRELRLVKHKSKIPVPKGITLFGVMDETGLLKEHEVYVTFTHDPEDQRFTAPPANDLVIVTRSPALHPGDIQIARNIIPPPGHPLTALTNCIVFSQHGERDLPSQLSGGDLDGDLFNVIWDERIIPKLRTFGAADYPRVEPVTLNREIQSSDMANFFVDFMKTDHLGVIAVRHMIFADLQPDGTRARECLKLAELHSNAVDFSKSGRPVNIADLPSAPRYRPDFLSSGPIIELTDKSTVELEREHLKEDDDDEDDGPRHGFYKSDKVIGKLYRAVDESQIWTTDIKKQFPSGGPSFWDELKVALDKRIRSIGRLHWKKRLDDAHRIREAYDEGIKGAMVNFADSSAQPLKELEVVMGFILNSRGIQTKRQRDKSTKLSDEFSRISKWVTNEMRAPGIAVENSLNLSALELCYACFEVACAQQDRGRAHRRRGPRADLESFRIVAASALIREIKEQETMIRLRSRSNTIVNVRGGGRMAGRGGRGGHRQLSHAEALRVDVENATRAKAQRSTSLGFESPDSTSSPATPSSGQGYTPSTGSSAEAPMQNGASAHHPGYQPGLVRAQTAAGTAGGSGGQGPSVSSANMPPKLTAQDLMAHLTAQYAQMQVRQGR
ncbi:RNA dependent RNA polymerase-domain-containing protein [Sordaria brevicollis]|uniref:RNA-dependent RNA polymerase n=1 Tax=Sordaria brevicollis TaxID=83679 RepID=A0AAE0PBS0_SORBR|nr:RNA dependent RNA polymerase-domain-containing protein [Sordaria brevicollis]